MNNQTANTNTKHRPSLTIANIQHILYLAKTEQPSISNASMSLISTLAPYLAKIENNAVAPAYITKGRVPAYNSLEALSSTLTEQAERAKVETLSKEARWAHSYAVYKLTPSECTLSQIQEAKEHMYLNELMSDVEVLEFEATMLGKQEAGGY